MKRLAALGLAVGLLAAAGAHADEPPRLESGDRGTMLATIAGRTPQEIPVRYIGIYEDFAGPGHDVHIVELEGPEAERVGAAHGMSGSPVYFDGRLVGALAYRLGSLPKEPIAGITPIEDMLDASRSDRTVHDADAIARPIATPVHVGGLSPAVRRWVAPHLEELGFVTVAGGGSSSVEGEPGRLAPGTPVGVELVRGDMSMGASGTVTLVEGDVVYAFGHPFFGTGRVEMPMAPAEVVHTLADMSGSFHMANIGASVGAILEDRQSAVVGHLGREARMIPMRLTVRGGDYADETYDYEVVSGSLLTPLLVGVATANSLFTSNGYTDKATVLAQGSIRLKDLPELPLEMAFSSTQGFDPALAMASTLFATLQGLWDNPIEEVHVEGVEIVVDVRAEPVSYRVESLHYDRGPLEPGETLTVRCVLREHRGGQIVRELFLTLPEELPRPGSLILAVGNPMGVDLALGDPVGRRLATARDLRTAIDALSARRSAHRLTAVIYEQGGAVVSHGMAWAELPPTAEKLLSTDRTTARPGTRPLVSTLTRAEVELDGPVEGGKQIRLKIERGYTKEENR